MIKQQATKGFTIIEVVLVLVIAGLIFLMVFIALPAMQRGQRDNARKNDVSLVASAVTTYTQNNRNNKNPDTEGVKRFVDNLSGNSDKEKINVRSYAETVSPEDAAIWVITGARCGESEKDLQRLSKGTIKQIAVVTKLEAGGGIYYCLES